MDFSVLGPLTVRVAGLSVDLGPPKARGLLAALLCRPGRIVSTEVLMDALWGGVPPRSAGKNIQLYIHRLRRSLAEPGRIRRGVAGYSLTVYQGELDSERFEALRRAGHAAVAVGRLTDAVALFRRALDLWHGNDAYTEVPSSFLTSTAAHRLAEARLIVLRACLDVELRLGRHALLVPELTALAEEHLLQEWIWADLMRALCGSGRIAEALATYQTARRHLAWETGLEPGPELQDLHRAILTFDLAALGQLNALCDPRPS